MSLWRRPPQPSREERLEQRAARYAAQGVSPRAAVMGGTTTGPRPKEQVLESRAYEDAVRGLGFCVRCGCRCRPQFCHRDEGKGMGIKTDVRDGWAGCPDCHAWLGGHAGGGRMPKEQRRDEEDELAYLTRAAVRAAGTWPTRLPDLELDDA